MTIRILDNAKFDLIDGVEFFHSFLDCRQAPETIGQRLKEEWTRGRLQNRNR